PPDQRYTDAGLIAHLVFGCWEKGFVGFVSRKPFFLSALENAPNGAKGLIPRNSLSERRARGLWRNVGQTQIAAPFSEAPDRVYTAAMDTSYHTPSIDEARAAYETLRKHGVEAITIRRRLGLADSSATIDSVVSNPIRRLKLINWVRNVDISR
ncbi:hypothetical protein, partial [Rhizobium sp. PL01]|uniref:hypothetical protein n=1 Tax=Rhizobium sp. PL01 TaxID=3085631 RepID=UPI0029829A8C